MADTNRHVTVNERTPSQGFNQFVEQQIQEWLRAKNLDAGTTDYEVAFFDEEPLGEVSCLVVVQSGERMWRSWETADEPRLALSRSLEHLRTEDEVNAERDDEPIDELTTEPITH